MIPKDKATAIREYIEAGYVLTPLNGKIPTKKEWQKTKYELLDADAFPGNYGVVLQDEDLVIDIDPRNFRPNATPWKTLLEACGIAPEIHRRTFHVATGGGGAHVYFKKPKDMEIAASLPEYTGVEFKTKGNQVVGAWCSHASGKFYEPKANSPKDVIQAPDGLLQRIRYISPPKTELMPQEALEDESEATVKRFTEFCKTTTYLAVEGQNGDSTTFKVACQGHDMGLPEEKTLEIMLDNYNIRCLPPWNPGELALKVGNAFRYANQPRGISSPTTSFDAIVDAAGMPPFKRTKKGIESSLRNAELFFIHPDSELYNTLVFNEFTGAVSIVKPLPWPGRKGKPPLAGWDWNDNDTTLFRGYCSRHTVYPVEFSTPTIIDAVVNAAHLQLQHPVREWLKGLIWDRRPRIDTWLIEHCGVVDKSYTRAVAAKTLMAAVARIFAPGIKFDTMLILEGEQGTGKSRTIQALGGAWYADIVIDPHNKDTLSVMRGKWICEISEMVHNRKQEADAVKSFLSKSEDVGRASYARISTTVPRQSIFIGTINPEGEYFKDTTGNRRYWPVYTRNIDVPAITAIREQLFAEALVRWRSGESLYLEREAHVEALEEQKARLITDDWQEKVDNWLERNENDYKVFAATGLDIFVRGLKCEMRWYQRKDQLRIANIMRVLGWTNDKFYDRAEKKMRRGYIRPGYELDLELDAEQPIEEVKV